jgi:putative MATE family efflux protein
VVNFLGATDSVRPYSMEYARWILISSPITGATVCLSQALRAEGSTTFSMAGSVSGCVINVILDPIFISVFGLGVAGAAIATGISKLISMTILFYPYLKRRCVLNIHPRLFTPSRAIYGEIARMGIPTMMRTSMMSISTILINNVAASFGDIALASISVANKSLRMVASAVMGFGQGFQPVAGYNFGAKKYDRVLRAFLYTSVIGAAICAVLGAVLAIFARNIIGVFSNDGDVLALGTVLIRTQCYVLPLHVWVMITTGFFQAMGKAARAGVMGLSRQLLSLIPCVLILTYFFGVDGLARAQAASDVLSFILAGAMVLPAIKQLRAMHREQVKAAAKPAVAAPA